MFNHLEIADSEGNPYEFPLDQDCFIAFVASHEDVELATLASQSFNLTPQWIAVNPELLSDPQLQQTLFTITGNELFEVPNFWMKIEKGKFNFVWKTEITPREAESSEDEEVKSKAPATEQEFIAQQIINDVLWEMLRVVDQQADTKEQICTELVLYILRKAEKQVVKTEYMQAIDQEVNYFKSQYDEQQKLIEQLQSEIASKSKNSTATASQLANIAQPQEKGDFYGKPISYEDYDFWNTHDEELDKFDEIFESGGLYIGKVDTSIDRSIKKPTGKPVSKVLPRIASEASVITGSKHKPKPSDPSSYKSIQSKANPNLSSQRELHQKKLNEKHQPLGRDGKRLQPLKGVQEGTFDFGQKGPRQSVSLRNAGKATMQPNSRSTRQAIKKAN